MLPLCYAAPIPQIVYRIVSPTVPIIEAISEPVSEMNSISFQQKWLHQGKFFLIDH